MAHIIDGIARASALRSETKAAISNLENGLVPGLAVILVGEDPASHIYVNKKIKACEEVGITSFQHKMPDNTSERDILGIIDTLNNDPAVHGIIVQLPLPDHMNSRTILSAIKPEKDVDGFHALNSGKLVTHGGGLIPCTPKGCLILLNDLHSDLAGMRATVVGRSQIVGRPMSHLLLKSNCTVLTAHRHTKNLADEIAASDIVVSATGCPGLIKGDWIKPGATVIDVGITRIPAPEKGAGKTKLVGDVEFDIARHRAGAITPVPGGVGPMTVACLLHNTFLAAQNYG